MKQRFPFSYIQQEDGMNVSAILYQLFNFWDY
jgi:hypothetical protein